MPLAKNNNNNTAERLSSLETSVNTLTIDVQHIARAVDALRDAVSVSQRPNWGNLIAGIGVSVTVIIALGSASLAPVTVELRHHADILEEHGRILGGNQDRLRMLESDFSTNSKVTKAEIGALEKILEEIRDKGSGITRERLAVIESKLAETIRENQKRKGM